MTAQVANSKANEVHDLALAMYHHLKEQPDSAEKNQHMFRMISAVERSAAGLLDEAGIQQALSDVEAAALFCQG